MRITRLILALAATAAAGTAPAQAGTFLCVPSQAGAAVTSGGPDGTCNTNSTKVQLPATAADQKKLIDLLPYVNFAAAGIGGKPTIQIKGANLQVRKTSDYVSLDGTGNLIVGDGVNYNNSTDHTGSENLIVGRDNKWTGGSNLMVGSFHSASGWANTLVGRQSTATGGNNFVSGVGNTASGNGGGMLGGYFNRTSGENSAIAGKQLATISANYATLADGSGDDVHWIRYAANGSTVQSSGPLTYAYSGSGYSLTGWKDVNLDKCSITVTAEGPDSHLTTFAASPYYTHYAYVRHYKPYGKTDTFPAAAQNVPHTVVANCNKRPGATG